MAMPLNGRHFYFLFKTHTHTHTYEEKKSNKMLSHHLYIRFGMASLMLSTPFYTIEILEILKKSLLSGQALLRTENYLALKQITICCPKFMQRSVCCYIFTSFLFVCLPSNVSVCGCCCFFVLLKLLVLSRRAKSEGHSLMFIVNNKTTLLHCIGIRY